MLYFVDVAKLITIMSSTSGIAPLKFVTEAEIEEKRKKRQEEWEKVRQPHQPLGDLIAVLILTVILLYYSHCEIRCSHHWRWSVLLVIGA